jgi:hypothetical protein
VEVTWMFARAFVAELATSRCAYRAADPSSNRVQRRFFAHENLNVRFSRLRPFVIAGRSRRVAEKRR